MKRNLYIIAVIFAATVALSSCSSQKCPAYSQIDTEQTDIKS